MFHTYYSRNTWADSESRSGVGSNLEQTETIRRKLPKVFDRFAVKTLLDVPCGDGNWWRHVNHSLDRYIGVDVVAPLIAQLQSAARPREEYLCRDVATDELPGADAVLCRDLLVHFSQAVIYETLRNLRRSGATYLITTTFPGRTNRDIETGDWRPIDLTAPPYNFPIPLELINENCTVEGGQFADKSLGIWRFADLPLD